MCSPILYIFYDLSTDSRAISSGGEILFSRKKNVYLYACVITYLLSFFYDDERKTLYGREKYIKNKMKMLYE